MSFGLCNNKTLAYIDFRVQMSENSLKLQRNEMPREDGKQKYLYLFSALLCQALSSVVLPLLRILNWNLVLDILCENNASSP